MGVHVRDRGSGSSVCTRCKGEDEISPPQLQTTHCISQSSLSICEGPLAVKAMVWVAVERIHASGWGMLYNGPVGSAWHLLYMAAVVVVLDYAHDAWFYFTHRLLHWRPLYCHVHYIHHK